MKKSHQHSKKAVTQLHAIRLPMQKQKATLSKEVEKKGGDGEEGNDRILNQGSHLSL